PVGPAGSWRSGAGNAPRARPCPPASACPCRRGGNSSRCPSGSRSPSSGSGTCCRTSSGRSRSGNRGGCPASWWIDLLRGVGMLLRPTLPYSRSPSTGSAPGRSLRDVLQEELVRLGRPELVDQQLESRAGLQRVQDPAETDHQGQLFGRQEQLLLAG